MVVDKKEPPCELCRPGVHPDNLEAVAVYFRCADQWRLAPSGLRMGLEAGSVEAVMRLMQVAEPLECFDQVRLLASEVAGLLAGEAEKERDKG